MAKFGYDRAKLEAEYELVLELDQADKLQESKKGEAQKLTKLRDAKLDEMDQWISDFKVVAKIALEDDP